MRPGSFKLKITLLSAVSSGIVLLVVGFVFLFIIAQAHYKQIDNEIGIVTYPKIRRLHEPAYWPQVETSLRFIFGDETALQFIVKVFDQNGRLLY